MTRNTAARNTAARIAAALGVAVLVTALAACAPTPAPSSSSGSSGYLASGKLTVGTGQPAFFPWVIDNKPQSGKGFESAVAYAVAAKLGFAKKDVVWVRSTFDQAIAPGNKDFDFNVQQFSITNERKANVDFSSPYYETTQTVITIAGSKADSAKSISDLRGLLVGAQTGTTSFDAIEKQIKPNSGAQAFNSNDDAKLALQSGTIDALVVDLPTAFYLTGAELKGGKIIGQLPKQTGTGDQLGLVLAKDSPLTKKVTAAVDALRSDGTLDTLAATWLANSADAPVLK
ncbi:ABC transporter substrate-binding protein [Glaciihabitans sp. GrIS 2.15]|uniref:ABC transporter substrate-binding protein n=1 Tax=Glaciihabitans sp. GrIS 2.15 TaxID=3071710 RepID=UPI002DFD8477|nr:polar amino acid transport system substrate-binding protein [Glaciihabitans sp. GrIS 2.15]